MSDSSQPSQRRSFAEWLSFSVAIVIVTTIVALILYRWQTQEKQPPLLSLNRQGEVRQAEGQFYVPFTVINRGGETVEAVQVVGELLIDGQVEETGEQQIDFLSSQETESGAFIFSRNPQEGQLIIRVASYKLP